MDEDSLPNNDLVYSYGNRRVWIIAGHDFAVLRSTALDFVRVRFDGQAFTHDPNRQEQPIEGSRCSDFVAWHTLIYLRRGEDGKWQQDAADVSASAPWFESLMGHEEGKGAITGVKVDADEAGTDGWTVTYEGDGRWTVQGRLSGLQGEAMTGTEFNALNGWVSFTITAGESEFEPGDKFSFTTFRSAAEDGKKNEIQLGAEDVRIGP